MARKLKIPNIGLALIEILSVLISVGSLTVMIVGLSPQSKALVYSREQLDNDIETVGVLAKDLEVQREELFEQRSEFLDEKIEQRKSLAAQIRRSSIADKHILDINAGQRKTNIKLYQALLLSHSALIAIVQNPERVIEERDSLHLKMLEANASTSRLLQTLENFTMEYEEIVKAHKDSFDLVSSERPVKSGAVEKLSELNKSLASDLDYLRGKHAEKTMLAAKDFAKSQDDLAALLFLLFENGQFKLNSKKSGS